MKDYKVSVIIPTHNNGDTIERAIMSVVNQNFDLPFEIVVVQDACSDNTKEVISKLKEKYDYINTFEVNNRSVMATRRDGLNVANGEYIMWLDGDDWYGPEMISSLYKAITESNADVVNGNLKWVTKKGIKTAPFAKNKTYNQKQAFKAFLYDISYRGYLMIKIFKKDLLKKVDLDSFPNGHYMYEDTIINAKYLLMSNKVVCIKDANLFYNKLNENSITSSSSTRIQDDINAHAYVRKCIEETGNEELLKIFRKTYFRNWLNLLVDIKLNRCENKEQKKQIVKTAKQELREIYSKNPLKTEGKSYSTFISSFRK